MSAVDVTRGPAATTRPSGLMRGTWRLYLSELRLILGRRRNQAGVAVLAAMPIIMAVAVKTSESGSGGPSFLDQVTSNGLFVPLAALGVELGLFLPLAVAMLSGDAIAGEANLGTLRYLLTVPVSRTRLLAVKFAALCTGAFWGVLAVVVPGSLIGLALFGGGPMTTLSGSQVSMVQAVGRLAVASVYLTVCLSSLAAVGLFVSTLTEQPIAVAISVAFFSTLSWILLGIQQVAWLHPYLVVKHWMSFGEVMRDPIGWEAMRGGVWLALGYTAVFWLAAWARFGSKDITS